MSPKKVLDHKRYPRGSAFYALSNCEISFQLSQASGEEPPTIFSDHGNEVHGVLTGKVPAADIEQGLREEADHLEGLRQLRLSDWLEDNKPFTEYTEKRLWMRKGTVPLFSGQPDKFVVQGRRVFLSDYKTGWHPLDHYVATNCQIRAYVALIDVELEGKVDEVTAAIHKPGKQSPPAIFDRQAIDDSIAWARYVATAAVSSEPKTPTRGPWCKYCSGKVLCPLWREEINTLAELSTAIVSDIPDSALRELAPHLELAKMVAEKLLARLYNRVSARPDFFADWHFHPQSPRRKIDDTIGAYNALVVREKALSPGEFLVACRLSITELEKRVRHASGSSVNETKLFLDQTLKDIMEYASPKPALVYDPKPLALLAP